MNKLPIAIVALAVVVMTLVTRPQTYWQGEEVRFAQALLTFDPVQRQPEPPGYPLYVAIGRLLNFFIHEPFTTLLVLSVIACGAGAVLVALAAAEILGDDWLGAAAALVLYVSPAMLVFAPLPNAVATGMALIAAGFLWSGLFAGAAIGVLPTQRPRELPMNSFTGSSIWGRPSSGMYRNSCCASYNMRTAPSGCRIWNGFTK